MPISARLIKNDSALPAQTFVPFSFPEKDILEIEDLNSLTHSANVIAPDVEAERIIAQAKAEAARIEQEAHSQMQSLVQAGVDAEIARVVNPWQELLHQAIADLSEFRSVMASQTEGELVRLALAIARKVIHREITTNPETVVSVARAALLRIQHRIPVIIHLHPDDFAFLNQNSELLETGHAVTLVEDKMVARGGCLIHAETGEVDARIDEQLAEIEAALLQD